MRILHLVTKSNWGGAQRCVHDLAVDAARRGHEVTVALGGQGLLATRLASAGVTVVSLPSLTRDVRVFGDLAAAREIWAAIGRVRPEVLHLHSSKAGGLGALIGRLRRVPAIVFTAHGWAFNERRPSWQRAAIRLLHLATVLLSHRTIAVAPAIVRQLGFKPLVGKRFAVIPNGVDPQPLATRDEARARIAEIPSAAKVLSGRGGGTVVGALAELHPIKGIDTLVEAVADLARRDDVPKFGVIVLGEGEARGALQAAIDARGLAEFFCLAGFVEDAPRFLSAFDIFAMPSRSEAMPMALLEAGNAGLAAVATRVGGIPEAIESLETGLLVSPDRPRELAEALRRLVVDAALRSRLGEALKARVRERFSRAAMSTATEALYGEVLANR